MNKLEWIQYSTPPRRYVWEAATAEYLFRIEKFSGAIRSRHPFWYFVVMTSPSRVKFSSAFYPSARAARAAAQAWLEKRKG